MFPVKTIETFAWIVPVKLNYESIVDRRGSKAPFLLKMNLQEISEADLFFERGAKKSLQIKIIKFINL